MKTVTLAVEDLTLEHLLREVADKDAVFLTAKGEVRFALVPADEGDQEVYALRANAEFMAYLAECKERAKTRPRKSLVEIEGLYGTTAPDEAATATP